eukprot:COSAG06_NODE_21494_length_755_cov_0.900915_1_plen_52_part_10
MQWPMNADPPLLHSSRKLRNELVAVAATAQVDELRRRVRAQPQAIASRHALL